MVRSRRLLLHGCVGENFDDDVAFESLIQFTIITSNFFFIFYYRSIVLIDICLHVRSFALRCIIFIFLLEQDNS